MQRLNLAIRMAVGAFPVAPGSAGASLISGVSQAEPPKMGDAEFLEAYSTMPWLRATTHRIAESVASVRWHAYAIRRGNRYRMTWIAREAPEIRRKMIAEAKQAGELVEIEDTPLIRLIHAGNPVITGGSMRRVTQVYLDIIGEAFWVKERNRAGVPESVWPIPPTWVRRTPTPDQPSYDLAFRGYQMTMPDTEILWFKDPNPVNPYGRGSGYAGTLADELEIDEYAAKHTKSFFYNGAIPHAVVSPRADSAHNTWSDTQRKSLENSWNSRHQGFWRAFKTLFAPIPIEIQQLSHSFKDQQLGELRTQERDTIVQVLGIPPELIGILVNSNRATIESSQYLYAINVLVPRLEHLRETLQQRLVPEYDDRIILEYDNPVPEDKEHKLNVMRAQPQAFTQNEWREEADFEEAPTGEVYHIPFNVTPSESLGAIPMPEMAEQAAAFTQRSLDHPAPPSALPLGRKALYVDDPADDDFYLLVHRVADRLTPRFQRRFREIIESARRNTSLEALEAALRSQIASAVEDTIPWNDIREALRQAASETFRQTVMNAGELAAQEMSSQFGITIGFNEASPNVAQFAANHSALLVTRIDETSRQAIRQAIESAFSEGRTADQVAREIRSKIGLLARQESALDKFKAMLVEQGRPDIEIQRRYEAMSRAMLRQRSQMIARTEMIDAANEGQQQLWKQAADQGVLDRARARRFWIITPDDRLDINVCEPIPELNPNGVGLDEPFQTPAGAIMRPTAHPGCRCTTTLRIIEA